MRSKQKMSERRHYAQDDYSDYGACEEREKVKKKKNKH